MYLRLMGSHPGSTSCRHIEYVSCRAYSSLKEENAEKKYMYKTPRVTVYDALLDIQKKITIEEQFRKLILEALSSKSSRLQSPAADFPDAKEHVYKSARGELRYLVDGSQSSDLSEVCQAALELDNQFATKILSPTYQLNEASAQVRAAKVSKKQRKRPREVAAS